MNERIKQLFNKAGVYAYGQNPGENSYGRPVDENKYEEDRYTKFAELIIRECLDITDAHTEVFQTDRDKALIEHIKQSVKQHFGVE